MNPISFKISNAELEVMQLLWRENRAVSFTEILTELNSKMDWEKSTIATFLRRFQKKEPFRF